MAREIANPSFPSPSHNSTRQSGATEELDYRSQWGWVYQPLVSPDVEERVLTPEINAPRQNVWGFVRAPKFIFISISHLLQMIDSNPSFWIFLSFLVEFLSLPTSCPSSQQPFLYVQLFLHRPVGTGNGVKASQPFKCLSQ